MEVILVTAAAVLAGALSYSALKDQKKRNLRKDLDRCLELYGPIPMAKGVKQSFLYGVENLTPCILMCEDTGVHVAYMDSPQQDIMIPYTAVRYIEDEPWTADIYRPGYIKITYTDGEIMFIYGADEKDMFFNSEALQLSGCVPRYIRSKL